MTQQKANSTLRCSLSTRKGSVELTELDRQIVRALQDDIPLVEEPYALIAQELGVSQEELLARIKVMKEKGILRRFGATLRHQKAGYVANAMSAWVAPEEKVEELGRALSSYPQVTHCYEREVRGSLPYNVYAMIHGRNQEECVRIAREVSRKTGITDYVLLFSSKENKKSSMQYF